jgi:uncharacterized membrane protein
MTVNTSASTQPGSYVLTVTGTSGAMVHSSTVTLVVNPPTTPDFSVTATPVSATAVAGNAATYTVTVTPSNGFTGKVTLSTSALQGGVSASFNPASVTGSGNSTLTLTTLTTTPAGGYPVTITGTSGTLTHSTSVTLVVADYSISATPSSRSVVQGSSTTYTVNVTALNGFTGTVSFSASSQPNGPSATFSPPSVNGSGSSTMTVNTLASTLPGSYVLTVTGTSGALQHTVSVTLVVNAPPTGDFSLSVTPGSRRVGAGTSTTFTVSIARTGGFTGAVSFAVSGPAGATGAFSPNPATGNSSTLTLATSNTIHAGNYLVTITGQNGTLTHSATVMLRVR